MFKGLSPNLMVAEVDRSLAFYRDVLGFEVVMTMPEEGTPIWGMVKRGAVDIMLQASESLGQEYPSLAGRPIGATLTLYLEVSDIQALYDELKGKVEPVRDLQTMDYGMREFAVCDGDGYILVFGQQVSQA
ncbi:MAG: VOC family protein [Chloroflexaceae bacterium]|nr:VOC family protein [Chloroflexaceae bacterium]